MERELRKKVRVHYKKVQVLHMKGRNMLELEERHTHCLVHCSLHQEHCIHHHGHSSNRRNRRSNPGLSASCGLYLIHLYPCYLYSCYAACCVYVFSADVSVLDDVEEQLSPELLYFQQSHRLRKKIPIVLVEINNIFWGCGLRRRK